MANNKYCYTYQEASKVAIALGCVGNKDYQTKYKQDPLLPSSPDKYYKNKGWSSWEVFLGGVKKEYYDTLEEASKAAIALGYIGKKDYRTKYKQDPLLPSTPDYYYKNKGWSSWEVFLGGDKKEYYDTLEEASKAAIALGCIGNKDYQTKYKQDPLLPSNPRYHYKNKGWVGWESFLYVKYCSYQEGIEFLVGYKSTIRLAVDYTEARAGNKLLPLLRNLKAWPEFYDFASFVGSEYENPIYAVELIKEKGGGVADERSYLELRKLYRSLPIDPVSTYGFTSFDEFLCFNKEKIWDRKAVTTYCAEHKIKTLEEYTLARKTNPYLAMNMKDIKGFGRINQILYKPDFNMLESNDLPEWVCVAEEYLASVEKVGKKFVLLKNFFTFALDTLPKEPALYFVNNRHVFDINQWLLALPDSARAMNSVNALNDFFNFVLENHCAHTDEDTGQVIYLEGYANPIKSSKITIELYGKNQLKESNKDPLPFRYIDLARKYLVPGAVEGSLTSTVTTIGDLFHHVDAKTDVFTGYSEWFDVDESIIDKDDPDCIYKKVHGKYKMWSPVRLLAIHMQLYMPFRGSQICWSDSGETDSHVLTNSEGEFHWQENSLLPAHRVPQEKWQGLFKPENLLGAAISKAIHVHAHINTNKTAKNAYTGYDIPWIDERVIPWMIRLRDWQSKYNTLTKPTAWSNDFKGSESKMTDRELKKYGHKGTTCFLFRDPTNDGITPLKQGALSAGFATLLYLIQTDELPLAYIKKSCSNLTITSCNAYFTLHSMRVSLITAFVRDAKIAPEIVQKLVGHSSLVMTIYYTKVSYEEIREQLQDADTRILKNESKRLEQLIIQGKMERAKSELIGINGEIITNKWDMPAAAFSFMDFGMCPNGRTRCHDGGEVINLDKTIYGPVAPGYLGTSNCIGCRHFATGPAFLGGLQLISNEISLECKAGAWAIDDTLEIIEVLEVEQYHARKEVPFVKGHELSLARSHYEHAITKFDGLACDLISAVRLFMNSVELLNRKIKGDLKTNQHSLITTSDEAAVSCQLRESSGYMLVDIVCQSAAYHQSASPKNANMERQQMLDLFAQKNGLAPGMFALTEKQQIVIGNEIGLLLRARTGSWDEVVSLMDKSSRITLNDLGLSDSDTEQELKLLFEGKSLSESLLRNQVSEQSESKEVMFDG